MKGHTVVKKGYGYLALLGSKHYGKEGLLSLESVVPETELNFVSITDLFFFFLWFVLFFFLFFFLFLSFSKKRKFLSSSWNLAQIKSNQTKVSSIQIIIRANKISAMIRANRECNQYLFLFFPFAVAM